MKYKILIIDDEEMILSMMEKCLKEKFFVYTANNAKKALALLNGGNVIPDIILLDINMPEYTKPYILSYYFFDCTCNRTGRDKRIVCRRR